jgi:hypothetical protein
MRHHLESRVRSGSDLDPKSELAIEPQGRELVRQRHLCLGGQVTQPTYRSNVGVGPMMIKSGEK